MNVCFIYLGFQIDFLQEIIIGMTRLTDVKRCSDIIIEL